mmetsp:Transcript_106227/g.298727  ORF Transcript_106227/g.298727 Transcript_106227/m.298727 type:complete len:204 (+) Transcript_106227:1818-2429(+)
MSAASESNAAAAVVGLARGPWNSAMKLPPAWRDDKPCIPSSSISSCFKATQRKAEPTLSRTSGVSCNSPALCLLSTVIAFLRMATDCISSFSCAVKAASSFSRKVVAVANAAFLSASSAFMCSIFAASSPTCAFEPSTSACNSESFASASAIALDFVLSLVSHQQDIFSYAAKSFSDSVSSCVFISCNNSMTRSTGETGEPLA